MFLNRSTHSWRGKVGGLSVCFIPVSVWVLWFCQQNIFVTCDILMDCFFSTDCGRASWIHFCWRQRLPWNPLLKDFFYTKLLKTKRWEIFWPDSSLAICFCEDISSEGAVFCSVAAILSLHQSAFVHVTHQKQPAARAPGSRSEDELQELVVKGHEPMMTVLAGRSRNLQIVRAMWTSGNTKVEHHLFSWFVSGNDIDKNL